MKRFSILGSLTLLVCCLAWIGSANGSNAAPTLYSTEVSIEPAGETTFLLRAVVKDASSGEVLAGPSVKMPAGETANAESTLPEGGTVQLTATVESGKRSAKYSVVVKQGDHVLSQHSAKVAL
jgi:hypothetical protein